MYPVTPRFLAALRESHSFYTYADLYYNGALTQSRIAVVDGNVAVDRTAQIRRTLNITLGDPSLFPKYVQSPLAPFGAELKVYQGITYPDGTSETVPLGVFTLEEVDFEESYTQSAGGLPVVTAYDRSQVLKRDQFLTPADYSGWDIRDAITTIIQTSMPGTSVNFDPNLLSAALPGGTVFSQDRLAAVQTLCTSLGGEGYFDVLGSFQVVPIPSISQANLASGLLTAAWTIDASTPDAVTAGASSKGVLVTAKRGVSRTDAYNGVVVLGGNSGSDPQPIAMAFDTDSRSPTYWGGPSAGSTPGPYGHVVTIVQNQAVTTTDQAQEAADALLQNSLGLARSLAFTVLPNPALEAGDFLKAIFKNGDVELHLLDAFSVPLNPTSGQMTGSTRTATYQLSAGQ